MSFHRRATKASTSVSWKQENLIDSQYGLESSSRPGGRSLELPFCSHVNLRQASRRLQAFGMSNVRYAYCFRTRQNQDAAPTGFPDRGANRKGQSTASCSLVSLPTARRYLGTAEDHGQDCGAIQKVRRHDSGPGEKDRFLSLIFATVLLPLLRIFWISGCSKRFVYEGLRRFKINPWDATGCGIEKTHPNASQQQIALGNNPTLSAIISISFKNYIH